MPFHAQDYLVSLGSDKFAQWLATHTQLGTHPETQDRFLIPLLDRFAGMYVLGVPGSGKSRLLQNLIAQDIRADQAVIVIDPHGDLTPDCLAQLPEDKLAKTYLLDMQDEAYPFGLNVFGTLHESVGVKSSVRQAQAIDRLMHCFDVVWPDVLTQLYLPLYVRAATVTLFANPGSTLVDMYRLITDDDYRHQCLQSVTDATTRQFWQSYDNLPPLERRQQVLPLRSRLESLLMGRSLVRNIVGQRETSINFRQAIENKEIIFIHLPIKTLAQDARLIGTLVVAQIHAAIFSFSDMPEHQRPGFSLYIDEFQNFATSDLAEMFTEGRKFGVRITVAHQYRRQLPTFLQSASLTARNVVCFRITPEDGREMAQLFLSAETTIQPEDIEPHPVEHLLAYGSDHPALQTFIEVYLRRVQQDKRGRTIEITKPGWQPEHIPILFLGGKPPAEKTRVNDPTPQLDYLLYQVMKTGQWLLPIPDEVVWGFANCGRGFYGAFRYAPNKDMLLSDSICFPPYLVVEGANGELRWTRPPESGKEQLYHFLFHLRMVMRYLAEQPIGKPSSLSTTEVARMLTSLPRRAAFVRSGDEAGVIYTDNTPPHVDAATLHQRLALIRDQTRHRYCRSLDEPGDAAPLPTRPIEEPPLPRWEVE